MTPIMRQVPFLFITSMLAALLFSSCVWTSTDTDTDFLPLDDSEYPYANIPRLVIETEGFKQIRNMEDYISAHFQIYDKDHPITEVLPLSVRGRGTSSFHSMPKYSLKLKFQHPQMLLGMPSNTEWALISNFADRTHLKNFITLKLYSWLGGKYTPQTQFVELYLNRQYQGLYLLSQTIKVGKDRINIPKNDSSFLFEKTTDIRIKSTDVCIKTKKGRIFSIKYPKKSTPAILDRLKSHLDDWEAFLDTLNESNIDSLGKWLDTDDYIRFYWVQELSKNTDANFGRSIFFTWMVGEPIHYGPVWDFDVAYGNQVKKETKNSKNWYIRDYGWDKILFSSEEINRRAKNFWLENRDFFSTIPDSITKYSNMVSPLTINEFKRWPVLENDEAWCFNEPYSSYQESIDSLNSWIRQRIDWIDQQYAY